MVENIWRISGKVVDQGTGQGLAGLRVEVWDWDFEEAGGNIWDVAEKAWDESVNWHDRLGVAVTDSEGNFYFEFGEDAFRDLYIDLGPDIYFKVFNNGVLVRDTSDYIYNQVQMGDRYFEIQVDLDDPVIPETLYCVKGTVSDQNGTPAEGLFVRALDRNLQSEVKLGECLTDATGFYRVQFAKSQLGYPNKERADLIVRVYEEQGSDVVLAESPLYVSAPPSAIVNLTVGQEVPVETKTEYQVVQEILAPELQGVTLEDLNEDDFRVLAKKVNLTVNRVTYYVKAQILSMLTGVAAEPFYGMFAFDIPPALEQISTTPRDHLAQSLYAAVDNQIIASTYGDQVGAILDALFSYFMQDIIEDEEKKEFRRAGKITSLLIEERERSSTWEGRLGV